MQALKLNAKPQVPRVFNLLRHLNQSIKLQSSSGAMDASTACTAQAQAQMLMWVTQKSA